MRTVIRFKVFLLFIALLAVPFFSASTAPISKPKSPNATATIPSSQSNTTRVVSNKTRATEPRFLHGLTIGAGPLTFLPQAAPETVTIYAAGCTTPLASFTTGQTVCAKLTGAPTGLRATQVLRRLAIVGPNGYIRSEKSVSALVSTDTLEFAIPSSDTSIIGGQTVDNRGTWYGISAVAADGSVVARDSFSVTSGTPVSDLLLSSAVNGSTEVTAGDTVSFVLYLTNGGPDTAEGISLTNAIPANTTFVEATSTDPNFTCSNESSVVTCEGELVAGATAQFTLTFTVSSGTAVDTVVTNVANVTSTTAQRSTANKTATSAVVVTGNAPPGTCVLTCPSDVVATADTTVSGNFGAFVTYGAAAGAGDCGSITNSPVSGSFFTVGTHSVTSTAENGGTCNFTVKVLGTPAPTISCPAHKSFGANGVDGYTSVDPTNHSDIGTPSFTTANTGTLTFLRTDSTPAGVDETGNPTPAVIKTLDDPFPVGTTGITWTVTDADGRTASCSQTIFVQEVARDILTISCPANVTGSASGCGGTATVSLGTPTTNLNDSHVTTAATRSDGAAASDPYPVGTTTVTWTATDDLTGNVASCTQLVTVTAAGDTTPPTFDNPPVNVTASTSTCSIVLDDELGVVTATDDCGTANVSRTGVPANFVFPTGTTIITYTATDGSGHTATATQTVTVTESPAIPPTITAPANVTVFTGAGATSCDTVVSNATLGTASASDNCAGVTVTRSPAGNTFPVGNTTVTWTATDRSGNTATATQTVTVIDNTPPVVTAPADVTLFTGPGATSCSVTVANLNTTLGTGSATDNCPGVGAVTRSGVPSGNVFPVGTTTVTYSATDAHGNTSSDTQVVTVVDNTVPVFDSCPTNIVLDPSCPTGAIATYATPTAHDNCGIQSLNRTAGLASGSVFPIGTTTVTHTATDIYGNTSSCSFTVTVKTPAQAVQDMITATQALQPPLSGTQVQGLLSKLNQALTFINNGNFNPACGKLGDFVSQVTAYKNNGTLTAAQADPLIVSANKVRNAIGCTNLACY